MLGPVSLTGWLAAKLGGVVLRIQASCHSNAPILIANKRHAEAGIVLGKTIVSRQSLGTIAEHTLHG